MCDWAQVRVPVPGRPAGVQHGQHGLHRGDPGAGGARRRRRVRRAGRAPGRAGRGAALPAAVQLAAGPGRLEHDMTVTYCSIRLGFTCKCNYLHFPSWSIIFSLSKIGAKFCFT